MTAGVAAGALAAVEMPVAGEIGETLQEVLEGILDYTIVRIDRDGRITGWNRGAERITGYSVDQALGRPAHTLFEVPARWATLIKRHQQRALERGHAEFEGWRSLSDGSRRWWSLAISALQESGQPGDLLMIARDLTDLKLHQELAAGALAITQAVLGGDPIEAVLRLVAVRARRLLHSYRAAVHTPDPSGEFLVLRAVCGRGQVAHVAQVPIQGSLAGQIHRSGRARIVADLGRSRASHKPVVASEIGPALFVPLAAEGRRLGVLGVGNRRGARPFHRADLDLLRLFADQAALALAQAERQRDRERLAVVDERARLGRDLHGGAVQSLYAATLDMGLVAAAAGEPLRDRLGDLIGQVDGVIRDLRDHVFEMRPVSLERRLDVAVGELAREFEARTGIATTVDIAPDAARLSPERTAELVPMLKEALSNVARHARARTCRVGLRARAGGLLLTVEDDGTGFDVAGAAGRGQGLRNFAVRADRLGARLRIDSAPGAGTALRLALDA